MQLPQVGELIADRYRVLGAIGEGGMARVLAAHHELLDKPIALKILSPLVPVSGDNFNTLVRRFLTEARAAAKIDSPHVTRVMEVGTLPNGLPYMVMERLEGCDLEELLNLQKKLPVSTAVDYVLQALAGLARAHAFGVIHRDLKPGNLFLARQADGSAVVKILDFGIAKLVEGDARIGKVTGDGSTVGSPMYMSPEQIRNASDVDERADVWAMGVVLYELIAGELPFDGLGIGQIFAQVLEKTVPSITKTRPDVPVALADAISRCLERDLAKRFGDVGQFATAIAPFATREWQPLAEEIVQTLRDRVNRSDPIVTVSNIEHRALTETSATLDGVRPARRSKIGWVLAAMALLGGLAFAGVRTHVVDRFMPHTPAAASSSAVVVAPAISVSTETIASQPSSASLSLPVPKESTTPSAKPKTTAGFRPTTHPPAPTVSATSTASVAPAASSAGNLFDRRF